MNQVQLVERDESLSYAALVGQYQDPDASLVQGSDRFRHPWKEPDLVRVEHILAFMWLLVDRAVPVQKDVVDVRHNQADADSGNIPISTSSQAA